MVPQSLAVLKPIVRSIAILKSFLALLLVLNILHSFRVGITAMRDGLFLLSSSSGQIQYESHSEEDEGEEGREDKTREARWPVFLFSEANKSEKEIISTTVRIADLSFKVTTICSNCLSSTFSTYINFFIFLFTFFLMIYSILPQWMLTCVSINSYYTLRWCAMANVNCFPAICQNLMWINTYAYTIKQIKC